MARSIEALIERQVQKAELLRKAAAGVPAAPCIALSRQPGAGGEDLARRVAARLGFEFYGIEIVERIATESHVRRQLVEVLDEHVRARMERYAADCFRDAEFRESDYARGLVQAIAGVGEHGGAVVFGRGAPYVLGAERTLRVLVVAPRLERLERIRISGGDLSDREAEERLRHVENERREFLGHHFMVDPDDASLYDVVLNTGSLGIEGAEEILLRVFEQRFPTGQGRGAQA
jgi:cytidylate kinase